VHVGECRSQLGRIERTGAVRVVLVEHAPDLRIEAGIAWLGRCWLLETVADTGLGGRLGHESPLGVAGRLALKPLDIAHERVKGLEIDVSGLAVVLHDRRCALAVNF